MLLTHRKLLQSKTIAIENDLRGTLRNFGLKVGTAGRTRFEARIEELVEEIPDLAVLVEPLLVVRRVLREQMAVLHRRLLAIVRDDEVCRRLMTMPGVGPVVALTYRATVDVPARFRKSKSVGAVFGLTCSRDQSGERDHPGAISRCGDEMMRATLYEAAQSMLVRSTRWSSAWPSSCIASGLMARSSDGPGKLRREHSTRSEVGGNSSSTKRWNGVPRGTMDEVSSHVCLDLPPARPLKRSFHLVFESHDGTAYVPIP